MQNSNPFDLKEVEECAMLLQQTFKNNNSLERRAAEEALVKLSEDRDRFFEILLALITLNQSNGIILTLAIALTHLQKSFLTKLKTQRWLS